MDVKTPSASDVPKKTGFLSYAHADMQSVQRFRKPMKPRMRIRNDYYFHVWWDQDNNQRAGGANLGEPWSLAVARALLSASRDGSRNPISHRDIRGLEFFRRGLEISPTRPRMATFKPDEN